MATLELLDRELTAARQTLTEELEDGRDITPHLPLIGRRGVLH
jgi:hypothetical protein